MSRFNEIESALLQRLRGLRAAPDKRINLFDIDAALNGLGFSHNEMMNVLSALEQDGIISFIAGNRLRVLKRIPE